MKKETEFNKKKRNGYGVFLNVEIYDKKSKKMFTGNIEKSSWTLKEVKERNKERKWIL